MSLDEGLQDLASAASRAQASGPGLDTGAVRDRARRRRRAHDAVVAAATGAAVVVAGAVGVVLMDREPEPPPPAVTVAPTPVPTADPTAAPDVTPAPTTTDPAAASLPPVGGWTDLAVDPAVFGPVVITATAATQAGVVVVGCARPDAAGGADAFPVWTSQDGQVWVRAEGPAAVAGDQPLRCLADVVSTPFGLFARPSADQGLGRSLLRSMDGTRWEPVVVAGEGHGTVVALFPAAERLTVLVQRAAENESRVSELWTSTDGTAWSPLPELSAALFDNGGMADVLATDDGLLAVGASPGGEFSPTAAAWASSDGRAWELTTPQGEGFVDCWMTAVTAAADGFVAAGSCTDGAVPLAVWSSPDGRRWDRLGAAAEPQDPDGAFLHPSGIAAVGADLYVTGTDEDASLGPRDAPLWKSADEAPWQRVADGDLRAVPMVQVEVAGLRVGFWPAPGWSGSGPVQVLRRDG